MFVGKFGRSCGRCSSDHRNSYLEKPIHVVQRVEALLEDLIGREGPFLETVCVPFAGLAILLWPLAVVGAVSASFIASFFLGFYGGIVVYQVYYIYNVHIYDALITFIYI